MVEESSGLSARKLAANRDNAKKSTGPKSQAGKERVRINALKQGRYANWFRKSLAALHEAPEALTRCAVSFWRRTTAPETVGGRGGRNRVPGR